MRTEIEAARDLLDFAREALRANVRDLERVALERDQAREEARHLRAELAAAADALGPAWLAGDVSLAEGIRRALARKGEP